MKQQSKKQIDKRVAYYNINGKPSCICGKSNKNIERMINQYKRLVQTGHEE